MVIDSTVNNSQLIFDSTKKLLDYLHGYITHNNIKKIILIGLSGVGKSTKARQLAILSNYTWFDTDHRIEQLTKQSVNSIFSKFGESYFRNYEFSVLKEALQSNSAMVISCGAGIVTHADSYALLKNTDALVVYVYIKPELLIDRYINNPRMLETRPLFHNRDLATTVIEQFQSRHILYANLATMVVSV